MYSFTAPAAIGIASSMAILGIARMAALYYQKHNPTIKSEDYPSWVKLIELVSITALGFSLAAVPSLYFNALYGPFNKAAGIVSTVAAGVHTAIAVVDKVDDLLPVYNPVVLTPK